MRTSRVSGTSHSRVRVRLLGTPSIEVEGSITNRFRWSRVPALIGYLLLRPDDDVSREVLAEALWPDRPEQNSRQNLRQTLLYLNDTLGPGAADVLRISRQTVGLNVRRIDSDIDAFLHPVEAVADRGDHNQKILDLYRGPFLPGYEDEWVVEARSQLAQIYFQSLVSLARECLAKDAERALSLAEAAIREEPFEDAPRAIKIEALRKLGRQAAAKQEFESYSSLLREQLSLDPGIAVISAMRESPVGAAHKPAPSVPADTEPIDGILSFLKEQGMAREAAELALAMVPYWIRKGAPEYGMVTLNEAFQADGRVQSSRERVACARLALAQGDHRRVSAIIDQIKEEPNDRDIVAECLLMQAKIDVREMRQWRARSNALAAIREARRLRDPRIEAEGWFVVAVSRFSAEQYKRVRASAHRAMRCANRQNSTILASHAAVYLANASQRLGKIAEAKAILKRAKPMRWPANSIIACNVNSAACRLLEDLGDTEGAMQGYRNCIEDYRRLSHEFALCVSLTYLGDLECETGQLDEALAHHREALERRKALDHNLGIATSLRGIGRALLAQGLAEQARTTLEESTQRYRDEDATSGYASSQLYLAEAVALCGDVGLAIRLAESSVAIFRRMTPASRLSIGPSGSRVLQDGERLLKRLLTIF